MSTRPDVLSWEGVRGMMSAGLGIMGGARSVLSISGDAKRESLRHFQSGQEKSADKRSVREREKTHKNSTKMMSPSTSISANAMCVYTTLSQHNSPASSFLSTQPQQHIAISRRKPPAHHFQPIRRAPQHGHRGQSRHSA